MDKTLFTYMSEFSGDHYYVARGVTQNREWLVIFGGGGLMETAFPPEDMDDYNRAWRICFAWRLSENGYFPQSLRRAQIIILEILQCVPVVIIFAFLDLGKNISFSDSLLGRIDEVLKWAEEENK